MDKNFTENLERLEKHCMSQLMHPAKKIRDEHLFILELIAECKKKNSNVAKPESRYNVLGEVPDVIYLELIDHIDSDMIEYELDFLDPKRLDDEAKRRLVETIKSWMKKHFTQRTL